MKSLSLTQAKHQLAELVQSGSSVEITRRGRSYGQFGLRMIVPSSKTPEEKDAAGRRLLELAKSNTRVKTAAKGVTAEIRRQRERKGVAG